MTPIVCVSVVLLFMSLLLPGGLNQLYTGPRILWTDVSYGKFNTNSRLVSLNGSGEDAINGSASIYILQAKYYEIKTALTFDFDDSLVFWGELIEGAIYKMDMLTSDVSTVYANNHSSVTSLSADWLANKLYWTDSNFDWIKVCDYNGTYHRTLVHTGNRFIGGIVVNPLTGYMYWSRRDEEPRIEMATLDGEDRQTLVYNISYFKKPQGLAIDFNENRLYWVDIKLSLLTSVSLVEGALNLTYHSAGQYLAYYLDIDTEYYFLSGTLHKEIYIQSRYYPEKRTRLTFRSFNPLSVIVYDERRQPTPATDTHPCMKDNGGCQQICISHPDGYKCLCKDGFDVDEDGRICIPSVPTDGVIINTSHVLSRVQIAGIVLGILVVAFVVLVVVCYVYRRTNVTCKHMPVRLTWVTTEKDAVDENRYSLSEEANEVSKHLTDDDREIA